MRINYFSDIHLEFGPLFAPDNNADIIIAAGDIGIYKQGVEWLTSFTKPVIYIAGNHEFYHNEYSETLSVLKTQCKGSNVHFLDNEQITFQGVRFLGCTLWTNLFAEGVDKASSLDHSLNDLSKIRFGTMPLDTYKFNQLNYRAVEWLEKALLEPFAGKTVVITHHAPLLQSWNAVPGDPKKLAYCNDLTALIESNDITVWIHGHIHKTYDYQFADTRILCNPRGYLGRRLAENFDLNRVVQI